MSKCSLKDINSYCGWKRKSRNSCIFSHMFVRKRSRWIISWAVALFSFHPAQVQERLDLPDSQTHSLSAGVWSSTGYYWLTCLNSASRKSLTKSFSILPTYESLRDCYFLPPSFMNILHVPCRCKFVAFSCLLPEKPCWRVFSHFTLGFIPLTP